MGTCLLLVLYLDFNSYSGHLWRLCQRVNSKEVGRLKSQGTPAGGFEEPQHVLAWRGATARVVFSLIFLFFNRYFSCRWIHCSTSRGSLPYCHLLLWTLCDQWKGATVQYKHSTDRQYSGIDLSELVLAELLVLCLMVCDGSCVVCWWFINE